MMMIISNMETDTIMEIDIIILQRLIKKGYSDFVDDNINFL